jgi:predicted CoA-binding protein
LYGGRIRCPEEDRIAKQIIDRAGVRRLLEQVQTVAVLGAHHQSFRAACYVPDYLDEVGYRVLPVNPLLKGMELWGEQVVALVTDLEEPVDLIDVFRRPSAIDAHVPEILAMNPLPRAVWFQLGIRNDEAARRLVEAGIDVVQDRCTLADHRALGLPRR